MPLLTLSPAGLTSQNGEAYLLPCQGLQALEHILSSTLSEPNPPPQPVVAVINVPDKARYLADKTLFATPQEPRMEIWHSEGWAEQEESHPLLGAARLSSTGAGVMHVWEQEFSQATQWP